MCAGDMHSSLLLSPTLQKWQLGFWFLCFLLSRICPCCACTQLLSLLCSFFVLLARGDVYPDASITVLQQRVPGSSLSQRERGDILESAFRLSCSSDICERKEGERLIQTDSQPWSSTCPSVEPCRLQRSTDENSAHQPPTSQQIFLKGLLGISWHHLTHTSVTWMLG